MKFLVGAILSFATGFIESLLSPIQTVIIAMIPGSGIAFAYVAQFFAWLTTFVIWALSWLPINPEVWAFITAYFIFRLTAPMVIHSIKIVVAWWHALVP